MPRYPALALFDIDGTLIRRSGPHHRDALVRAIRLHTGLETTTDGIPLQGMIDPDIIRQMVERAGATPSAVSEKMGAIMSSAQNIYVRTCPSLLGKACPGAAALLRALAQLGAVIGLVTGNLTRIGWKKVERAGLKRYFRFGAFGEMAPDRAGLAKMAFDRARREGWISDGIPVSLIGDSPSDIQAARASGARAIAVATGLTPVEELRACSPDLLVEDLRRLRPEMLLERGEP